MAGYSNPYFQSTYDEYKSRQLKQRSGQDFLNDSGYQSSNPTIPSRPEQSKTATAMQSVGGSNGVAGGIAGAAAGITSQLGKPLGEHGFGIDPYAGYTGSLKGLSTSGPIGAVIGGIGGEASGFIAADKATRAYNANNDIGGMQYDINGKPIYNSAGVFSAQRAAKELGDAENSAKSWWQGGKAGGVAGIDSTVIASTLGGFKKRARKKQRQVQDAISKAQTSYNSQEQQFQQQQNQNEEYSKRMNNQNRINNLYKIPTSYQSMF
jgi:hypothetical protein